MRVIFQKDVPRVGKRHDIKEVNDGYAVNFLLPKKLAVVATPKAIAELESHKKEIMIERQVQDELLRKNLEEIKNKIVHIRGKADEKGHLFSGIHTKEIVEALEREHHATIDPAYIALGKPIKQLGEFEIPIEINHNKSFFKLIVEGE